MRATAEQLKAFSQLYLAALRYSENKETKDAFITALNTYVGTTKSTTGDLPPFFSLAASQIKKSAVEDQYLTLGRYNTREMKRFITKQFTAGGIIPQDFNNKSPFVALSDDPTLGEMMKAWVFWRFPTAFGRIVKAAARIGLKITVPTITTEVGKEPNKTKATDDKYKTTKKTEVLTVYADNLKFKREQAKKDLEAELADPETGKPGDTKNRKAAKELDIPLQVAAYNTAFVELMSNLRPLCAIQGVKIVDTTKMLGTKFKTSATTIKAILPKSTVKPTAGSSILPWFMKKTDVIGNLAKEFSSGDNTYPIINPKTKPEVILQAMAGIYYCTTTNGDEPQLLVTEDKQNIGYGIYSVLFSNQFIKYLSLFIDTSTLNVTYQTGMVTAVIEQQLKSIQQLQNGLAKVAIVALICALCEENLRSLREQQTNGVTNFGNAKLQQFNFDINNLSPEQQEANLTEMLMKFKEILKTSHANLKKTNIDIDQAIKNQSIEIVSGINLVSEELASQFKTGIPGATI